MGMLYLTMEDNGINLAKSIKLAICDLILAILSEYQFGIAKKGTTATCLALVGPSSGASAKPYKKVTLKRDFC